MDATTKYPSIEDIAHTVMDDPNASKEAKALANFVAYHVDHIAFHRRVGAAFAPGGPLGRRLEGVAQQQKAALPGTAEPVADPVSVVNEPEPDVHNADAAVHA